MHIFLLNNFNLTRSRKVSILRLSNNWLPESRTHFLWFLLLLHREGISCNEMSPDDLSNFAEFLIVSANISSPDLSPFTSWSSPCPNNWFLYFESDLIALEASSSDFVPFSVYLPGRNFRTSTKRWQDHKGILTDHSKCGLCVCWRTDVLSQFKTRMTDQPSSFSNSFVFFYYPFSILMTYDGKHIPVLWTSHSS